MISWRRGFWQGAQYAWRAFLQECGVNYPDRDGWVQTPWWHPMRWLFQRPMRYWSYDDNSMSGAYDGLWRYGSYEQCARSILKGEFDLPDPARCDTCGGDCGQCGGTA